MIVPEEKTHCKNIVSLANDVNDEMKKGSLKISFKRYANGNLDYCRRSKNAKGDIEYLGAWNYDCNSPPSSSKGKEHPPLIKKLEISAVPKKVEISPPTKAATQDDTNPTQDDTILDTSTEEGEDETELAADLLSFTKMNGEKKADNDGGYMTQIDVDL